MASLKSRKAGGFATGWSGGLTHFSTISCETPLKRRCFANSLLGGYPRFWWRRRRAPATSAFKLFCFHKLHIWSIFISCLHEDIVYQDPFHSSHDSPTKIGRVCSKVGRLRPFDPDVVVAPRTKSSKQLSKRLVCDQKPHRLAQKVGTIQTLQAESTNLQVNKLARLGVSPFAQNLFFPNYTRSWVLHHHKPTMKLLSQEDLVNEAEKNPLFGPQSSKLLRGIVEIWEAAPKCARQCHPYHRGPFSSISLRTCFYAAGSRRSSPNFRSRGLSTPWPRSAKAPVMGTAPGKQLKARRPYGTTPRSQHTPKIINRLHKHFLSHPAYWHQTREEDCQKSLCHSNFFFHRLLELPFQSHPFFCLLPWWEILCVALVMAPCQFHSTAHVIFILLFLLGSGPAGHVARWTAWSVVHNRRVPR